MTLEPFWEIIDQALCSRSTAPSFAADAAAASANAVQPLHQLNERARPGFQPSPPPEFSLEQATAAEGGQKTLLTWH